MLNTRCECDPRRQRGVTAGFARAAVAAFAMLLVTTACGGGGGDAGTANGGGGNGGGSPPPPPPVPPPAVQLPLQVGKRWLYDYERRSSVTTATGVAASEFVGQLGVEVERQESEGGWRIRTMSIGDTLSSSAHVVFQDRDGLQVHDGSKWRRVVSNASGPTEGFWFAGDPVSDVRINASSGTVETPAGPRAALVLKAEYSNLSQSSAPIHVSEQRTEYYVDGIGLVMCTWSYSKNDHDPRGIDESVRGSMKLTHVDGGPFPAIVREREPNDDAASAQVVDAQTLIEGDVGSTDPSGTLLLPQAGLPPWPETVHDVFKVTLSAPGDLVVSLAVDSAALSVRGEGATLFVGSADAGLVNVSARIRGWNSAKIRTAVPAGTYHVAVRGEPTLRARGGYRLSVVSVASR